jgi:aerobic-type carbon monoxide dehydrogenase small subunit (CoxS/CutS family)
MLRLIEVRPLKPAKVGIVTTGSEVYTGRIKDGFGPVLKKKFEKSLGSTILEQVFVSDQVEMTVDAILSLKRRGADFIAVTGGMSVDPDDQTPAAIRKTGAMSSPTARRPIPGPCSCSPIWMTCRWSACPAASCTTKPVFSIWSCPGLLTGDRLGTEGYCCVRPRRPVRKLPQLPLSGLRLWQTLDPREICLENKVLFGGMGMINKANCGEWQSPRNVVTTPKQPWPPCSERTLGLTGTKVGCGEGQCGACSVIIDGKVVRTCALKMKRVDDGAEITTIEGIGTPANPHPLQLAWMLHGAAQCGFCSPGFIVSAKGSAGHQPPSHP